MINQSIRIIRYIFAFLGAVFVAQTVDSGISFLVILFTLCIALALSNRCIKNGPKLKQLYIYSIASFIVVEILSRLLLEKLSIGNLDLLPYVLRTKFELIFLTYLIILVENTLFWTVAQTLFLEVLATGSLLVLALKGHRGYHIDIPSSISSLTWKIQAFQSWGIEPPELLATIGVIFSILTLLYSYLSSRRTLFGNKQTLQTEGKPRRLFTTLTLTLIIIGFLFSTKTIFESYSKNLSQVMNGVGEASNLNEGKSNLGFNKASTPSKQPAALLRLQNSYDKNPWAPMMYLREGALSEYSGKEIVKAGSQYDKDAPTIDPNSPYYLSPPENVNERENILQAVYVLSDKAIPFSLDTPTFFKPIKNPNPKRFKYTYLTQSNAPVEPLVDLLDDQVGNRSWTKEMWAHYLRGPGSNDSLELSTLSSDIKVISETEPLLSKNGEDLRYALLAEQLTSSIVSPMKKVTAIVQYLSEESIYVLEPNHNVTATGDPVAPYLFPRIKRGYCVHFAHSAVYLFRLAGIPARIGTGYLVDLQYAKGGDILVQMGDRHAWPEVYVQDKGWMVFDVTPQRAENDQVPIPDQDLLEQLMSEIDPIEILEGIPPAPENLDSEKSTVEKIIDSKILAYIPKLIPYVFILFILAKFWLRHSWRLPSSDSKKLSRLYRAYISTLEDIGRKRSFGDTRLTFSKKVKDQLDVDSAAIFNDYLALTYSNTEQGVKLDRALDHLSSLRAYFHGLKGALLFIVSYLNPLSLPLLFKVKRPKTRSSLLIVLLGFGITFGHAELAYSQVDSFDLDSLADSLTDSSSEKLSTEVLIRQALLLFNKGKGIDARAKLEKALEQSPNDYRPFLYLGQYYLSEVAHFKLAYRYIAQAKFLFEKLHPNPSEIVRDYELLNQHALLLYLLSEAQLNLDRYEDSLKTLNQYGTLNQPDWYPGQKAWVLMKLKRIEEAIVVAKNGLLEGADPKRTWNILGILLSISGEREMSINAFQKAVQYEFRLGLQPQVATPLNNAGEVYRELFRDAYAESAWKEALSYPDGCEHILPSVNLSILYTDQLRLFQAEQSLRDFEACYAQKPERKDSEHRTILALARGKLKLLSNNLDESEKLLNIASDDQQWFGKIGTNENDVKFASWITQALLYRVKATKLAQSATDSYKTSLSNYIESKSLTLKAIWLERKARIFALEELDNFEDLSIRHTDTMISYPLLGRVIGGFGSDAIQKRFSKILATDNRESVKYYYDLYTAEALLQENSHTEANSLFTSVLSKAPEHERLVKVMALSGQIKAELKKSWWWSRNSTLLGLRSKLESLYKTLPIALSFYSLPLPVSFESNSDIKDKDYIKSNLFSGEFMQCDKDCAYRLVLTKEGSNKLFLQLYDSSSNRILASQSFDQHQVEKDAGNKADKKKTIKTKAEFVNKFVEEVFSFKEDAPAMGLVKIPFAKG